MTFPDGNNHVYAETLLRRIHDIVTNAKPIPLSNTVRLDSKEEVLELLEEAIVRLPDELREARWMLKEREEFLAKTQREADDILEAARNRAERHPRPRRAGQIQIGERRPVVLKLRLDLEDQFVLPSRRVDGGDLPLAKGVIERLIDGRERQPEP